MRLLLLAPTVDCDDVGEAWVAYQWAAHSVARHDVTVLTYRKRGRPPVAGQLPGAHVVEWEEPPVLGRAERLNSLLKPGYVPFYVRARRWLRAALAAGQRFDVVHQPAPVAMRYPSPATGLGLPLVVGPVGGGLSSPPGFESEDTAPWYVGLRRLDRLRLTRDPLLRRTYEEADCILGIAPYVKEQLAGLSVRRFEVMSDTALSDLPPPVDRRGREGPVRLVFVGRLIRTKGARDAVAAMAHLADLDVRLDVIGDGFDRDACESLVRELGLEDRVLFHGRVAHTDIAGFYARGDVFMFPSYREPGGTVVFEAMGAGLPLVVADRGGPAYAVDESCGIRVTPHTPQQYAGDLALAVRALVESPERRLRLGDGARRRVESIGLWQKKIDAAETIYREVAGAPG